MFDVDDERSKQTVRRPRFVMCALPADTASGARSA
jgi:hypothetical protein